MIIIIMEGKNSHRDLLDLGCVIVMASNGEPPLQHNTIHYDTTQCNALHCTAMKKKATQYNAVQCN